ncbi:MAG: quinone-dependent dihydroorotate dehydrogenase [Bacteroidia bacterium]|nr:quinone-dependent dihydroorotate dehydrogenase [Bacteroidia bacterium]
MFKIIRSILFLMSAEKAHHVTLSLLNILAHIPGVSSLMSAIYRNSKATKVLFAGIEFPNRVGLAAGFDKNAKYLKVMKMLGFGHVEIGTVTPLPQAGNDLPRLFRLVKDEAIINRMGFNNDGVKVIKERLQSRPNGLIVGGNIGKNKLTPNEEAVNDYMICFRELYPCVDYFTVNVSSPNTPGLRELQDKGPLTNILNALMDIRKELISKGAAKLPVFLKIAPDLTESQLDDIVTLTHETGIDGLVATNTTISREGLSTDKTIVDAIGAGGLSGKPVKHKADEVLVYLNKKFEGKVPLIGVGGIYSSEDAQEKIKLGAGLVQIYSGFIYKGPALTKSCA